MKEFFWNLRVYLFGDPTVEITAEEKKNAIKESSTDTAIGAMINIPINFSAVYIAFAFEWTALMTSIFLTATFTCIAIVRKYVIRIRFLRKYRASKAKKTA